MEARASDAEKKVQELNAKLERLQTTSAEQKRRVQKTQHALKVAEVCDICDFCGTFFCYSSAVHSPQLIVLMLVGGADEGAVRNNNEI
jgi:hypothetical protein